jgi:hypothetical protein
MAAGRHRTIHAPVTLVGLDGADHAAAMRGVVPGSGPVHPGAGRLDRREAAGRPVGRVLAGPEQRFEERVLLLPRGRLNDGVTPRRSIVTFIMAPFTGLPLSAWSARGLARHLSARMARLRTGAARSAVSRS